MLDSKEIEDLRQIFVRIDKDSTGMISRSELWDALKESNISNVDVDKIFEEVDYRGND